jgi:hypothetical protein
MWMVAMAAVMKELLLEVTTMVGASVLVRSVRIGSLKIGMVRIVVVEAVARMSQDDARRQGNTRKLGVQNIHTQKQVGANSSISEYDDSELKFTVRIIAIWKSLHFVLLSDLLIFSGGVWPMAVFTVVAIFGDFWVLVPTIYINITMVMI